MRWVGDSLGSAGVVFADKVEVWGGGAGRVACGDVGVKRVNVSEGLRDMIARWTIKELVQLRYRVKMVVISESIDTRS